MDEASGFERPENAVHFVTIHGHRRAYRMMGSGPAILLLHGIGDTSRSWLPVMGGLAEHHTVIAPDLLGHGDSAKPRADYSVAAYANGMRDLLEVLDIDRVTVVGHSLGGGVAAQFAYQYPERCERLVLVATGGVNREVVPLLRWAAAPFAELGAPFLHLPTTRFGVMVAMRAMRALGTDIGRDSKEFLRVFNALPSGGAQTAFTRTLRSVVDWRGQVVTMLDRCYLTAEMPTLLVWGEHDAVIPVTHAHIAHDAMPGSRLELYAEAGHFPHHNDPERFVQDMDDFIASTEPCKHDSERWRELLRRDIPARVEALIDLNDGALVIE
jgi:pimeloyl-ACP methyl ester carboxylesterase